MTAEDTELKKRKIAHCRWLDMQPDCHDLTPLDVNAFLSKALWWREEQSELQEGGTDYPSSLLPACFSSV